MIGGLQPAKKEAPKPWGALGPKECSEAENLTGRPHLDYARTMWPIKRGEHSAGAVVRGPGRQFDTNNQIIGRD